MRQISHSFLEPHVLSGAGGLDLVGNGLYFQLLAASELKNDIKEIQQVHIFITYASIQ